MGTLGPLVLLSPSVHIPFFTLFYICCLLSMLRDVALAVLKRVSLRRLQGNTSSSHALKMQVGFNFRFLVLLFWPYSDHSFSVKRLWGL